PTLVNANQALTGADALQVFQEAFGQGGQLITDLVTQLQNQNNNNQNRETSTAKVVDFYGKDEEDPVEWLTSFTRAANTNRWTTEARKCQVAAGYLKGAAADWYDGVSIAINGNWDTANNGNNFVALFNGRFVNETKKNQWYQELAGLRQLSNESVDSYANKFKKLVTRVGMTDNNQQKRMFLMGLNPAYTPLVYSSNPGNLDAAIVSARAVEVGFNFATGSAPKTMTTTTATTASAGYTTMTPIANKMMDPTPVNNNELDELTKKIEQLAINYANLTTAMTAQTASPVYQRPPQRTPVRNNNYNNNRSRT